MADGSRDGRTTPQQMMDLTFSVSDQRHSDTKKCSDETFNADIVKLSSYTEQEGSKSCERSDSGGVVGRYGTIGAANSRKSSDTVTGDGDDRKKRCLDRYDSSESSDSGVAVLSPTESGGCSGSDITEPRSPRSPESSCSNAEEGAGLGARMPPWAGDPAPPGQRRIAVQQAPLRRPNPPNHRRITEYFNHKMKPQNGLKRGSNTSSNDDTKRKCLPKNNISSDLEKYISYLSQTLNPKTLLEIGKLADETRKQPTSMNGAVDGTINTGDLKTCGKNIVEPKYGSETLAQGKLSVGIEPKTPIDPSANGITNTNKLIGLQSKIPIPAICDKSLRIAPAVSINNSPRKMPGVEHDTTKFDGIVSSTTKLDSRMNGVMCGSNNLSLNLIASKSTVKKELLKKPTQAPKRTNRKSSACIANSKNLTWSKANNLKQIQLQQQNCTSSVQTSVGKIVSGEANSTPNINIQNGVRQIQMTMNGNLSNLNVPVTTVNSFPVTNLQNCHQINIPQSLQNNTVSSNNLASFVAVPQNVMLTTLRIPQNGITPQTLNQQNNLSAFNRPNVNVASSPTKLNGQLIFPLVQNLNGTVVQIPNLMTKMPNFVLPQASQMTSQRPDHLQTQQAQILFNGTLLKLANTMNSTYPNINKPVPATSQSLPTMNKNVTGMQAVGMTVQPKQNYTVNFSTPLLVPQPGFIVTSVPNINVKETWSYTNTNTVSSSQTTCSNPIVHHPPPIVTNFTTQTLHTSSIPIAPVKPPDNPIQGTEPPSSTVKETETSDLTIPKNDVPWLSKTVNNNVVPLDTKITPRPFVSFSNLSEKTISEKEMNENQKEIRKQTEEDLRKVEEVERREETIFTQITVLKDVSSNVQNAVIEANFCNATTESSESGIGTDKSIDSPSDSQTSKECDEDSTLSLSVSVSSVEVDSCQKSPILKQPKTIRFPPRVPPKAGSNQRTSSTDTTSTVTVCLWENCKKAFDNDCDLLEHLQSEHVETQSGQENYVCLWERCKVRGKPSCSRLWLERHASSHGGNKPFKCIFDGCGRRFSTQILLERHVNNHFNESSPNTSGNKKTTDSAPKLIRRNGKKLRYRRQPWSARMFDFFDPGTMEGLAWRLSRCTRWRLGGACPLRESGGYHTLTLHAALAATRYNVLEARREALLTYYPPHVIEDEWVPEKDVKRVKKVEISSLPVQTKVHLYDLFCDSYRKTPSPPPNKLQKGSNIPSTSSSKVLPQRSCTSTRLLNNLLAKQKKEPPNNCSATYLPLVYKEEENKVEVSGAKKRKMGRRYGGNSFWPCGR